jgi:hypothetical protein
MFLLHRGAGHTRWAVGLTRHRDHALWTLPGGHITPEQDAGQTALREAFLSTGHGIVLVSPPHQLPFPDGFGAEGERAVSTPWWIVHLPVPVGICAEAHIHVDHLYVGLIDSAIRSHPGGRPPFRWATTTELPALDMSDGIRRLATEILTMATDGTLATRAGVRRHQRSPSVT